MAKVLAVGVATLDLVQVVEQYPVVDSEIRAKRQYLWRGGNATNTLVVLNQLGHCCSWLGTLADDLLAEIIQTDLEKNNVDYSHCPKIENSITPTSHILLTDELASRNIIHYRSLRELIANDFKHVDFSEWEWVHFEGRNINETLILMRFLKKSYPEIILSLEVEKPRAGIEKLFKYADHCLFSRFYAQSLGYNTAEKFLRQIKNKFSNSQYFMCAWGQQGAMFLSKEENYTHVEAAEVEAVDTRAAGDVFNAAYINARLNGEKFLQSIEQACDLAGKKCAQFGIDNL